MAGGQPQRPARPTAHKVLSPSLYNDPSYCHTWMDWAETRMQELWKMFVNADMARDVAGQEETDKITKMQQKHDEKLCLLRNGHVEAKRKHDNQKASDVDAKTAALTKREKDLREARLRMERIEAESATYDSLCKDVKRVGERINEAIREMKSLTSGKGRPEQAFKRWEGTHCTAEIKTMFQKIIIQ
ncbi:hypothetical protein EK21DRAFT_111150 [Setomelanomma holmii]|uniref:Uncharacterized protein n=1 Tax=Setomelanomma holmii TaxID=210430 RepID=A0A9P4HAZ5_9PLEO|nr:hypothetical protein EK21DRAFT_111150 [Setomelanomma holmii]